MAVSRSDAAPRPFPERPLSEYSRSELLWDMRTTSEGFHRHMIHHHAVQLTYLLSLQKLDSLPDMSFRDFIDTCNKSVPIYIPDSTNSRILHIVLHNYVYRRWFRPYRSEIERQRFICKFVDTIDLPEEVIASQSTIDSFIAANRAVCAEVEACRARCNELVASRGTLQDEGGTYLDPQFHILQPLFQALLIIISSAEYDGEDSGNIGRIPVLLVRTGVEAGLSAPITFDPIADKVEGYLGATSHVVKTSLETAIGFVLDLESREAAAFGLQPDPVAAGQCDRYYDPWQRFIPGERLHGQSSQFVDTDEYPQWAGDGEFYDSFMMTGYEQRQFRIEARIAAARSS